MKRIAIFCDGTWNTPDKSENGKRCQTNEFIHPSVVERYKKDENYRPKNLVDYFNQHSL